MNYTMNEWIFINITHLIRAHMNANMDDTNCRLLIHAMKAGSQNYSQHNVIHCEYSNMFLFYILIDTNYKKCENISCGNGEDSMQCRIPKKIKSIDCFCIIMENNCINNEENFGLEEDEGEKQIWVENGCHGWFRVCYKKGKICIIDTFVLLTFIVCMLSGVQKGIYQIG